MASGKTVTKIITFNASTLKTWQALTDPEIIKQWLFGTIVISDWKVNSPIIFTGSWQGTEYKDKGNILKFEKGKVFQYNYWSGFSGLEDIPENYSVITFELIPKGKTTELKLTQSNFATETMYEHSDKNWTATLDLMKSIIEK